VYRPNGSQSRCFKCFEHGHFAADCDKRVCRDCGKHPQGVGKCTESLDYFCTICNSSDHPIRLCPQVLPQYVIFRGINRYGPVSVRPVLRDVDHVIAEWEKKKAEPKPTRPASAMFPALNRQRGFAPGASAWDRGAPPGLGLLPPPQQPAVSALEARVAALEAQQAESKSVAVVSSVPNSLERMLTNQQVMLQQMMQSISALVLVVNDLAPGRLQPLKQQPPQDLLHSGPVIQLLPSASNSAQSSMQGSPRNGISGDSAVSSKQASPRNSSRDATAHGSKPDSPRNNSNGGTSASMTDADIVPDGTANGNGPAAGDGKGGSWVRRLFS